MTTLLGLIASGIFLTRLIPQPVQLFRTRDTAGVSPLAALNATIAAVAWLIRGLEEHQPVVWIVSLAALVPSLITVGLLARKTTMSDLGWAATWALLLTGLWLGGALAVGLAAGVLVTQGPQVRKALQEEDLSGLTPATWWLSVLDATTWGVYGLALGDAALLSYFIVLLTCSIVVLLRLRFLNSRQVSRLHVP
ncbi:MAG TPA: hypothetical protein DEG43_13880 [Acidimicrobiaceae bacterium]|nr:hypothetical protein [Acidimicrobiaceae bacterium]